MWSEHDNYVIGTKQDISSALQLLLLKSVGGTRALFSFASRMTDSCPPHKAVKEVHFKIPVIGYRKTR